MVYGAGATTCGAWTASKEQDGVTRAARVQWLEGFLSGVNMAMLQPLAGNLASSGDPNGYIAYVDAYCAANPLDNLHAAAEDLAAELLKRKTAVR